jgi:IS4 transposase
MNQGKMVFAQLMDFASHDVFKWCVKRYKGNYRAKEFTCWRQFLCMSFGQLTHRESISDTLLCLKLHSDKLYHLGIGKVVNKSTLTRANENRDWRIFKDFALKLIENAKDLYKFDNQLDVNLKGRVFAIDATVIDLCLTVFWWASFRSTKAAVKLHTMLDIKTSIPEFILVTEGDVHDVNALDSFEIEKGSYYVMDKAYVDYKRLYRIHDERAYFVVRAKSNLHANIVASRDVNEDTGVLSDQTIILVGYNSAKRYPGKLRLIQYYDAETEKMFFFLTNNFKLSALTVAKLYKHRWYIELFFKWIKQHLKIKSFWGQSENAVKTQIWIAIATYVIVAIAKKRLNLPHSLYEILQLVSISAFDRTPLRQTFSNENYQDVKEQFYNQLKMF